MERYTLEERQAKSAWDQAKKRVRKANQPLRAKRVKPQGPGQRDPRQVYKDHKGAVARLFCVATYIRTGREAYGVQVAHQRFSHAESGAQNPGMGRKSHDWRVLPLSHQEHIVRQHNMDEVEYWAGLGLDENAVAAIQKALFAVSGDHEAMLAVLRGLRTRPTPTPEPAQ